eukprot:UN03866
MHWALYRLMNPFKSYKIIEDYLQLIFFFFSSKNFNFIISKQIENRKQH